ncbi:hypothetical protein [Schaalia vaccimaxillae]|uniref:hypothetical protein n=1 Tax=Schaalia vaccimaxillae TaxID=183916 RepID=UPI001FB1470B|nr:hypothetical protein [Schaalia vaccimaxillae]
MEVFLRDLESRFDEERRQEMDALVNDLTDAERAGVTLAARISAAHGTAISAVLRGGRVLSGTVVDSASTWMLLRDARNESLVPLSALVAVWPLGIGVGDAEALGRRIGIGHVLRELSEQGVELVIDHDAGRHQGKIAGVYADHIDLAANSDVHRVDSRDRIEHTVISLLISGLRAVNLLEHRWL